MGVAGYSGQVSAFNRLSIPLLNTIQTTAGQTAIRAIQSWANNLVPLGGTVSIVTVTTSGYVKAGEIVFCTVGTLLIHLPSGAAIGTQIIVIAANTTRTNVVATNPVKLNWNGALLTNFTLEGGHIVQFISNGKTTWYVGYGTQRVVGSLINTGFTTFNPNTWTQVTGMIYQYLYGGWYTTSNSLVVPMHGYYNLHGHIFANSSTNTRITGTGGIGFKKNGLTVYGTNNIYCDGSYLTMEINRHYEELLKNDVISLWGYCSQLAFVDPNNGLKQPSQLLITLVDVIA